MKTYRGGERVKGGFYWNLRTWTIVPLDGERAELPGGEDVRYRKVPVLALVALAPVMGGLYVMYLPLLGFALVFGVAGTKVLDVAKKAATTARELAGIRVH